MKQSTMIGLAVLGAGAWYFYSKSKGAGASSATSTGMGSSLLTPPASGDFGDPADPGSVAYACNTAFRLRAIGHPLESMPWADICAKGGAAVPTDSSGRY